MQEERRVKVFYDFVRGLDTHYDNFGRVKKHVPHHKKKKKPKRDLAREIDQISDALLLKGY